jgi:hypothetical protein
MGLIIRSSDIHAAGCYTTSPITKGSRVVEYTGPRITKEAADAKYSESYLTYLFGLGNGDFVIDGHCAAMFINHSCEANCETEEIDGRVWIKAIADIPAGAELVYDYNLYDGGDDEAVCNCGSSNCRKTMYSPEELQRRKRVELAKARRRKAAKKRTLQRAAEKKKAAVESLPNSSLGSVATSPARTAALRGSPLPPVARREKSAPASVVNVLSNDSSSTTLDRESRVS